MVRCARFVQPAIHGLKTAVRHRFVHPESKDLPGPHPELVKFLEAPYETRKAATEAAQKCRERFKIAYVPPKGNADRKKRTLNTMQEDRDSRSKAAASSAVAEEDGEARKALRVEDGSQQKKNVLLDDDDSATEDEDESASIAAAAIAKTEPASQAPAPATQTPLLRSSNPVKTLHGAGRERRRHIGDGVASSYHQPFGCGKDLRHSSRVYQGRKEGGARV